MRDRSRDLPPKGHKWQREKEERMAQIAENMKKMPQMIEDHRQQKREQRRQSAEKSLKDPTKLLAVLKKKGSSKSQQELEKLLKQHKQK